MNPQERIHQLQILYSQTADRLVLRINTLNQKEFRFWLTRRFFKKLWPALTQSIARSTPEVATQNPQAQAAVMNFNREAVLAQADFSTRFQDQAQAVPLGTEPTLISRARLTPHPNGTHLLSLHPEKGYGIELVLDANLLHSLCKLLQDGLSQTDWDLRLAWGTPQKEEDFQINLPSDTEWKLH